MIDPGDPLAMHRNFIFLQPLPMRPAPARPLAVRSHDDTAGVAQHPECILDRFVVRTADRDALPAHPVAVAVLAEKHAVAEALFHPRDLRREMENAGRDEQAIRAIGSASTLQRKAVLSPAHALDLVLRELNFVISRLLPAELEQLGPVNALRKAEIVAHFWLPPGH